MILTYPVVLECSLTRWNSGTVNNKIGITERQKRCSDLEGQQREQQSL